MKKLIIGGYASVFGIKDLAGDIVQKGAFKQSLSRIPANDIAMLFQHDSRKVIGRWNKAIVDDVGLWVEGYLYPDNVIANHAQKGVEKNEIDGLSIGFRTLDFEPLNGGGRALKQVDLREISLVSFPMLPRARLKIRAYATDSHINNAA